MLLLLLACQTTTPQLPTCAPGEVRLASRDRAYPTLAEALLDRAPDDAICLGEGEFSLPGPADCAALEPVPGGRLELSGAGLTRTRLLGNAASEAAGCPSLSLRWTEDSGALSVHDLEIARGSARLSAPALSVARVRVSQAPQANHWIFRAESDALNLEDLDISDHDHVYGHGVRIDGDGSIRDLSITDIRTVNGYFAELDGQIAWTGGQVRGVVRSSETEGYDTVETWGAVTLHGVEFADNDVNGPLLTGYGALTLEEVGFASSSTSWRGTLTSFGALSMSGGGFRGTNAAQGAIALYQGGTATLTGVAFDDAGPCGVSGDEACLVGDPGANATLRCDVNGCR